MLVIWAGVGLLAGTALGALATVAVRGEGQGFCVVCGHFRCDARLIPLAGILLARPCPKCGRSLVVASAVIQLGTAASFAAMAARFASDVSLLVVSAYAAVLVVISVVDYWRRLIPNVVTYPSMLLAVGLSLTVPAGSHTLGSTLFGGAFGGGLFLALYFLAVLLYHRDDALGMGDVKLALLIGLMFGWPRIVATILLGSLLGVLVGVVYMVRARSSRVTMPYGTALALGALGAIFWFGPIG